MPLLRLGVVSPRLLDRRGGFLGFVGQAAVVFRDPRQFLRVLLQRLDAAAFVDDLLTFVEQVLQVHLDPLLGATVTTLSAANTGALDSDAMAIQGGQKVVLCASPAVVVVAVKTEAELIISSVVV
jgi:hypothetical protein